MKKITKEEIEEVIGPVDKYTMQIGPKSAEDNNHKLHTILTGNFKIYLSEFDKSINEDKYIANCREGVNSSWTWLTSDDLVDILLQIKKHISSKK